MSTAPAPLPPPAEAPDAWAGAPDARERPRWKRLYLLGVAVLFALGLAARLIAWRQVFPGGGVAELVPTDTFYYLRFARLQLAHLPHFVHVDPFVNFPWGAEIEWPPLHTALVALALALAGHARAEVAAAWVCPAIACVEWVLLARVSGRRLAPASALLAMAVLALTPAIVEVQQLGTADHHVHEPMFAAALVLLFADALDGDRRAAIGAGILLALARLLTPSGLLLIPVVGAAGLLAALSVRRERAHTVARALVLAGGVAAGILAAAVLAWGLPRSFEYECLSAFVPLFVLAAAFGPAAIAFFRAGEPRHSLRAIAMAVLGAAALVDPLSRALRHFAHRDPMLRAVDELTPLWRDPAWAKALLGPVLFLAPLALVLAAVRFARERKAGGAVALVAGTLLGIAAAQQARFAPIFAGAAAVLIARELPSAFSTQTGRVQRIAWGAVLVLLAVPAVRLLQPPRSLGSNQEVVDRARPVLTWLRDHTPSPGDPWDASAHPSYGVAASYQFGHLITWWAQRPAIATPFALVPWHDRANAAVAKLLSESDDEQAFADARALRARYVLATPMTWQPGERPVDPARTLAARLFHDAGMGSANGPATAHFRLVHQTSETDPATHLPFARVFESVPGARIIGSARPGEHVVASLRLQFRTRETLDYRRDTVADANGRFELVVAFPAPLRADGDSPEFGAVPPYRLERGPEAVAVAVSEQDVEEGRSISVPPEP